MSQVSKPDTPMYLKRIHSWKTHPIRGLLSEGGLDETGIDTPDSLDDDTDEGIDTSDSLSSSNGRGFGGLAVSTNVNSHLPSVI